MKERFESFCVSVEFALMCLTAALGVDAFFHGYYLDALQGFFAQLAMFTIIVSKIKD